MKVYKGRGIGDIYYELVRDITNFGVEITTRGHRCLELPEPVALVYASPGYCWMDIPERRFNPFFAMAEIPWILSGNGDAQWISYFNKQMLEYLDDGLKEFHGSYGMRIRRWTMDAGEEPPVDQIEHVVRKLKEDPFSRQAVISLWDPILDNLIKSKDIPCNNMVYYSLRNGVLKQTVVIRSNDIIWGTPVNAIQFTHIHALVAGMLGVKMGEMTYVVQNLHYYLDLYNPTLGHVLNAAMQGDLIEAQKINSFGPCTEQDLTVCTSEVNELINIKDDRSPQSAYKILGFKKKKFFAPGYWGFTIPQMIWIYIMVKEGLLYTADEIDTLAGIITHLPEPLPSLIKGFWAESKNPFAKEVVHAMQSSS